MWALVIAAVALALVFAIAAAVVGREAHRLVDQAPRPVFDLDEAVAWVAAAVPFEVAAQLSHDDVRALLTWSLERLAAINPGATSSFEASTVAAEASVDHVVARAEATGLDCTPAQVRSVLDAELGYLEAIGAMGPPEAPPGGLHAS